MNGGNNEVPGLWGFLEDYPSMTIKSIKAQGIVLHGKFAFKAKAPMIDEVSDYFNLIIEVPKSFPRAIPGVTETGGRIPKEMDFHVNRDGTLCLGQPIRLLVNLAKQPTLVGFAENCLVPYLLALSYKLKNGGPLLFSELAHGAPGMLADCAELLGLESTNQVLQSLRLLALKKRQANKQRCPCGCSDRLGKCNFRQRLMGLRTLSSRSWFQSQYFALIKTLT